MNLHWRFRLDRTVDFQKFCGLGLDRIQFHRIRTGLGHFIIIQPMGGTTWFRISFLSTYVWSYKFLEKMTPILQKLIERFLIYHCFGIFTTRGDSH